jgi:hypothetical protein
MFGNKISERMGGLAFICESQNVADERSICSQQVIPISREAGQGAPSHLKYIRIIVPYPGAQTTPKQQTLSELVQLDRCEEC